MGKFFNLESTIEGQLKKFCNKGYVLHGTPHRYEQDTHNGGHVFIPKNHTILANKSPIHAMYYALFDDKKSKLSTFNNNGYIYASVILNSLCDSIRNEGYIYVFSEKNFIKKGMLYIKNPKNALLETLMIKNVKITDFKPPIYHNLKILKEKTL